MLPRQPSCASWFVTHAPCHTHAMLSTFLPPELQDNSPIYYIIRSHAVGQVCVYLGLFITSSDTQPNKQPSVRWAENRESRAGAGISSLLFTQLLHVSSHPPPETLAPKCNRPSLCKQHVSPSPHSVIHSSQPSLCCFSQIIILSPASAFNSDSAISF